MKAIIAVILAAFVIFIILAGDVTQKGMFLAILSLIGLILLFYKYAQYTRNLMAKHDQLCKTILIADKLTGFIQKLDAQRSTFEGKEVEPGVKIEQIIGTLKMSIYKYKTSQTTEKTPPSEPKDQP